MFRHQLQRRLQPTQINAKTRIYGAQVRWASSIPLGKNRAIMREIRHRNDCMATPGQCSHVRRPPTAPGPPSTGVEPQGFPVCHPIAETLLTSPTPYPPGSPEKVRLLARRFQAGLPLHVPGDAPLQPGEPAAGSARRLGKDEIRPDVGLPSNVYPGSDGKFYCRPTCRGERARLGPFQTIREAKEASRAWVRAVKRRNLGTVDPECVAHPVTAAVKTTRKRCRHRWNGPCLFCWAIVIRIA